MKHLRQRVGTGRRLFRGAAMPRCHRGPPTQRARALRIERHVAPHFWQGVGFGGRPVPAPCVFRKAAIRRASRLVNLRAIHSEDTGFRNNAA